MKRVHPFFFMIQRRDKKRRLRPHQIVDSWPMWNIGAALAPLGYELGDARINFPPPAETYREPTQLVPVDTSEFHPDSLLMTTTRIPVGPEGDFKKQVSRGYTDLEAELEEAWRQFVQISTRGRVLAREHLAPRLPQGFENRFDMYFYQNVEGAPYRLLGAIGEPRRPFADAKLRTVAFLLRLPRLPRRGFGYLGVYAMSGPGILIWSHLLRERHPDLLREPGFVMAELVGDSIPEHRTDFRWIRDWRAEILLSLPIRGDAPARQRAAKPQRPSRHAA